MGKVTYFSHSHIMKFLATFLSLAVLARAEPTCDECVASVDKLVARLTSEESLAEQVAILTASLCPTAPDPATCETELPRAWPLIGQALFPEFLQGAVICADTGICSMFKEITCEDCQAGVQYIIGLMNDPDQQASAIEFLSGDAFCADIMKELIPAAMAVLGGAFNETQDDICQDVNG